MLNLAVPALQAGCVFSAFCSVVCVCVNVASSHVVTMRNIWTRAANHRNCSYSVRERLAAGSLRRLYQLSLGISTGSVACTTQRLLCSMMSLGCWLLAAKFIVVETFVTMSVSIHAVLRLLYDDTVSTTYQWIRCSFAEFETNFCLSVKRICTRVFVIIDCSKFLLVVLSYWDKENCLWEKNW